MARRVPDSTQCGGQARVNGAWSFMRLAAALAAAVLCLVLYCLCCGLPSSSGDAVQTWGRWVTWALGPKAAGALRRVGHWAVFEPNPIFQLLYVFTMGAVYAIFVVSCFQYIPNPHLSWLHRPLSMGVVLACVASFVRASTAAPTVVTPSNQDELCEEYDYDGLLYKPSRKCRTCHTVKPARSKHCSICGLCIARADHHCVWLNQCVGKGNLVWFLLFLAIHVGLCLYGGIVIGSLLRHIYTSQKLATATFVLGGKRTKATMSILARYMLLQYWGPCILFLMSVVMGIALSGFLGYHLFLITCNSTTNETSKIDTLYRAYDHVDTHRKTHKRDDDALEHEFGEYAHVTLDRIRRSESFYTRSWKTNAAQALR